MRPSRPLTLTLALTLFACAKQPAPRDAYDGQPQRAQIVVDCSPALVDASDHPCVQIDVFAEGEGSAVAAGEWLKIHYIVTLPNGTELDSSHGHAPLSLRLGQSDDVIEGMHLGLEGMRVGERRRFVVPPKLGYGGRKVPGVPPDADLIFFVELMERRESL